MKARVGILLMAWLLASSTWAQKFYLDAQVGTGTDFMAAAGGLRYEHGADWGIRVYGGGLQPALFVGAFEGLGFGADVYKLFSTSESVDTYAGIGAAAANGTGNIDRRICSFICTYPRGPASAWMAYGLLGVRLGAVRLELQPYYRSINVQGGSVESRAGVYSSIGLTIPIGSP